MDIYTRTRNQILMVGIQYNRHMPTYVQKNTQTKTCKWSPDIKNSMMYSIKQLYYTVAL